MCIILELYIIYFIFYFTRKIILYVLAFLKLQNIYKGDFQTAVYGIPLRSPFRDIVVEKNQGEWKKKRFAFSRKTFAFPQETLHSLAKRLRSLTKPGEFGQTIPVYFTACSGYSSYVYNGSIK